MTQATLVGLIDCRGHTLVIPLLARKTISHNFHRQNSDPPSPISTPTTTTVSATSHRPFSQIPPHTPSKWPRKSATSRRYFRPPSAACDKQLTDPSGEQFIEICRRKDASCTFLFETNRRPEARILRIWKVSVTNKSRFVTAARIKKNKKSSLIKFKVRCSKHLYTLALKDAEKAEKLKQSLPPSMLAPT